MPLMKIHRNPEPTRLIRMGYAPEVIQLEPKDVGEVVEDLSASLTTVQQSIEQATIEPPPVQEPVKNKRGRPAKMAKDKDLNEVVIAPAQKVSDKPQDTNKGES